jgi:hypothetical protein
VKLEEVVPAGGPADGLLDGQALDLDVLEVRLVVHRDAEQDLKDETGPVGHVDAVDVPVAAGDDVAEGVQLLQADGDDSRVGDGDGDGVGGELLPPGPPLASRGVDQNEGVIRGDLYSGSLFVVQSGGDGLAVDSEGLVDVLDLLRSGIREVDPNVF